MKLELKLGDKIVLQTKWDRPDIEVEYSDQQKDVGVFTGKGFRYRIPLNNLTHVEGDIYKWQRSNNQENE